MATLGRTIPAMPVRDAASAALVGTASGRIQVEGVDELYDRAELAGRPPWGSREGVGKTDFGSREFATIDADGNLVTFFERVSQ